MMFCRIYDSIAQRNRCCESHCLFMRTEPSPLSPPSFPPPSTLSSHTNSTLSHLIYPSPMLSLSTPHFLSLRIACLRPAAEQSMEFKIPTPRSAQKSLRTIIIFPSFPLVSSKTYFSLRTPSHPYTTISGPLSLLISSFIYEPLFCSPAWLLYHP